MRRAPALTLILLLAAPPALAQDDLQPRLRQAIQRLQQGDALGALLDLEKILETHEDSWEAYYYRGRAQSQMGDDIGAHESFQRAAHFNPGDPELHFLAASAAYALADFDTAWEQSIRAIQAGYERRAFDDMFKAMRRYSAQPANLDSRASAARVVVTVAPVQGEQSGLDELALALRRTLVAAANVALVSDATRARYVLEIGSDEHGVAQARLLTKAGEAAPLQTWPIDRVAIPEMVAEDVAAQLEAWLGERR